MFLYQCSIIDKTIENWSRQSTIDINTAHTAHIANINEFKETVYSHNVCMSLRMCKLFSRDSVKENLFLEFHSFNGVVCCNHVELVSSSSSIHS